MNGQLFEEETLKNAFIELTACGKEEAERFLPLLLAAEKSVQKRLKAGVEFAEWTEDLLFLTAAIAAEQWALIFSGDAESIRIGDIAISGQGKREEWRCLVEMLSAVCAPVLEDEAFYFQNSGGI